MKYIFYDKGFKTKKEVKDFFSSMLWRYEPGDVVNANDCNYLLDLIKNHNDFKNRLSGEVDYFFISKDGFGSQNFNIKFTDKRVESFSYINCINQKNHLSKFTQACRNAVAKDISRLKNDYFNNQKYKISQISDKIITCENSEVDHVNPTFNHIRDSFIRLWNIDVEKVEYMKYVKSNWFKDKILENRFIKYHKATAYFLIVHKDENRKRGVEEMKLESKYLRIKK